MNRRDVLIGGGLTTAAAALANQGASRAASPQAASQPSRAASFWPDGIRMPITLSLMFESGGQSRFGAATPFGNFTPGEGIYDLPTISWYRYGVTEGIPRALDMLARLKVPVTSHMTGLAVETYPEIAKSIVQAGHEAAAHGWDWSDESSMSDEQERAFIQRNVDVIRRVTGQTPVGYNAPGLRGTRNVLSNLHDLGFKYHIDDVSRDEPFMVQLDAKREIAVVPYAVYLNDLRAYEARYMSDSGYLDTIKRSFDQLYKESATRRRMLAITIHDRLVRPEHAATMEEALRYMLKQPGVTFMKKVEIASFIAGAKDAIREPIGVVYPTIGGLYRG